MTAAKVIQFPTYRQWTAAKSSNLTADWTTHSRPIDLDIRYGLSTIRARCRDLAQNSDHAKGFLRIVRNNLIGETGFVLQSRAARANGAPDIRLRQEIESWWSEWGRRGNCDVSGKFSWKQLQRHVAETVARDGEAFIRIASPWPGAFGFALEVIDAGAVDIQMNGEFGGNRVVMGIELDDFRRPVAYHLYGEPPINSGSYRVGSDRYRVPAAEMIHVYLPEFCWQTRGVPWLAVGAQRMHMISGAEDAEVTASRASAAKFAAYEALEWAPGNEPSPPGLVDESGNPLNNDPGQFVQDLSPGSMEIVPRGYQLKLLDPQHPNANMGDFLKWGLRSVATGWGVSYNTLGNDAEGVNYTSLRFFLGVERDNWKEMQDWFKDDFPEIVRQKWTTNQIHIGNLTARPGRESQLHNVYWQARRWDGPDPVKQAVADKQELEIGSTTLTEVLARKGRDFDDVLAERIEELSRIKAAAEKAGLSLSEILPYLQGAAASVDVADTPSEVD